MWICLYVITAGVSTAPGQAPSDADEDTDAQSTSTGWEFAAVPAISYDADDGFGYGALIEVYNYGQGRIQPYRFTVQPKIVRSTGGRRDYVLFVDAPEFPWTGWRTTSYLGYENELTSPYYGMGNDTEYHPSREEGEDNSYFYRFGLLRRQAALQLQRSLGDTPIRALAGFRVSHVSTDATPHGKNSTLLFQHRQMGGIAESGWSNSLQVGLVWDTRDRETGPRRGVWSELLVRRVDEIFGSAANYTRWTLTDRRYFSLAKGLTFANRFVLQQVYGHAPFYDLYLVESSYKRQEGLGGANSLRGIFQNRFAGKALFLWNAELRWRMFDLRFLNRTFYAVLSGFVDSGRVWEDRMEPVDLAKSLHHGYGGGIRVGMGDNFVIALDIGYSEEAGVRMYTGTGYLF